MQDPSSGSPFAQLTNPPILSFPEQEQLKCPRCESTNTKFCYYNNYNLSQPRHFCKACRRYWTKGGALRNIPVGGGTRKNSSSSSSSNNNNNNKRSSSSSSSVTTSSYNNNNNNNNNNNSEADPNPKNAKRPNTHHNNKPDPDPTLVQNPKVPELLIGLQNSSSRDHQQQHHHLLQMSEVGGGTTTTSTTTSTTGSFISLLGSSTLLQQQHQHQHQLGACNFLQGLAPVQIQGGPELPGRNRGLPSPSFIIGSGGGAGESRSMAAMMMPIRNNNNNSNNNNDDDNGIINSELHGTGAGGGAPEGYIAAAFQQTGWPDLAINTTTTAPPSAGSTFL